METRTCPTGRNQLLQKKVLGSTQGTSVAQAGSDERARAESSLSGLAGGREIMSAAVGNAMATRPHFFVSQHQRVAVGAKVARTQEPSWIPAGGKRAREELNGEAAKFQERTDRMWDMLQVRLSTNFPRIRELSLGGRGTLIG